MRKPWKYSPVEDALSGGTTGAYIPPEEQVEINKNPGIDPVAERHSQELAKREQAARLAIAQEYRRRGSNSLYGALGEPTTDVKSEGDDWVQKFQFGSIRTLAWTAPRTEINYFADVYLAAVKCFGTDDPGGLFVSGEDEPYLIVTSVTPASTFLPGSKPVIRTWRSQTYREISAENNNGLFGQNQLMFQDLFIGPYGIGLKVLLMDHEHGSEADLEKEIKEKGDEAARELIDLAAALAGIPIDEATEDQVLDSTILRVLGAASVSAITQVLKDDKIAEKDWIIDGEMLKQWVDNSETGSSFVNYGSELPASVETNYPREEIFGMDKLFSGGGGSYKVYLRVIPKKVVVAYGGS